MGAHTIGQSTKQESGFNGIWTPGQESVFNTTYYQEMVDPTLKWKNKVCKLHYRKDLNNGHPITRHIQMLSFIEGSWSVPVLI